MFSLTGLSLLFSLTVVAAEPPVPSSPISEVLKGASGLSAETNRDTPEWKAFEKQVDEFIRFRRGRMTGHQKLQYFASCLRHSKDNPLCDFTIQKRRGRERSRSYSSGQIVSWLSKGEVQRFRDVPEGRIHRALRSIRKWPKLDRIATAVLKAPDCPAVGLSTALALKAEEFLPDPKFRTLAIDLYSKAEACGPGEAGEKARYRLSMLELWEGQCVKADPLLAKLIDQKDGDYVSRALYWRHHCAKVGGNQALAESLRARLLKEYPLSFHSILLGQNPKDEMASLVNVPEPAVLFRSQKDPSLNPLIRAVELMEQKKEEDLAADLIDDLEDRLEKAEPRLRLYVAVLLGRYGEKIPQFHVLATVFRDDPSTVSRATLEMFYPLKRFDVLKMYEAKLDPYFVAAVIRQESGFAERAKSPAGALGLMQLMPRTARRWERVSKRELFDAKTNVRLGVKFFANLMKRYGSDAELALAAYNAGPEKVDQWKKRYTITDRALFLDAIPYKETRDYVALISRNYFWYLKLYSASRAPASIPAAPASDGRQPIFYTMFGGSNTAAVSR